MWGESEGVPQNCDAKLAVIFESAKFSSIILCHNFMQKSFWPYGTPGYTSSETPNAGHNLLAANSVIQELEGESGHRRPDICRRVWR